MVISWSNIILFLAGIGIIFIAFLALGGAIYWWFFKKPTEEQPEEVEPAPRRREEHDEPVVRRPTTRREERDEPVVERTTVRRETTVRPARPREAVIEEEVETRPVVRRRPATPPVVRRRAPAPPKEVTSFNEATDKLVDYVDRYDTKEIQLQRDIRPAWSAFRSSLDAAVSVGDNPKINVTKVAKILIDAEQDAAKRSMPGYAREFRSYLKQLNVEITEESSDKSDVPPPPALSD
ncbi:MAG: hypothetical protein GXX85_18160 [Ignavibacteria bacterium]|nr:hypothetical protein [Ignavibacteria bacterium]